MVSKGGGDELHQKEEDCRGPEVMRDEEMRLQRIVRRLII